MTFSCGENLLKDTAKSNGLDLESSGRKLTNKRVGHRANSKLVNHGPSNHKTSSGKSTLLTVSLGNETKEAEDAEDSAETAKSIQIESATADSSAHQCPSTKHTNHVDGILSKSERIGVLGGQTGLFEEQHDPCEQATKDSRAQAKVRRSKAEARSTADRRGFCDADGLEDTPWQTTEDFGGEEHLDVLGGEEEGNAAREPDETADDRVSITEAL
ncbi:hypothetical protein HG531_007158 [Fusarium graminearum]|nr:hypothetical protein HG531_007158 [Fusarium graminearum]